MKVKTTKLTDKARKKFVREINFYKKKLETCHPSSKIYKQTKGYLDYLIKELKDYDKFRGYDKE